MKKILLVDDDIAVTNHLMVALMQTEEYEPTVLNDSREVAGVLDNEKFDVMLLDMDMPYLNGLDIIKHVSKHEIDVPIIVLTGVADVDMAVESLKLGVFDYLTKPVEDVHLLGIIGKAIKSNEVNTSINQLPSELNRDDLEHKEVFDELSSQAPSMVRLYHEADKMSEGDMNIFIYGEMGTGKTSIAKAIHKASNRSDKPFFAIDIGIHKPDELAALLFGTSSEHGDDITETRGLLESADGSTLFINNIDLLPSPLQIRLDRVIHSKEFYRESSAKIHKLDVRIIAASVYDLSCDSHATSFSRDLISHIKVNSLRIPPLREHKEDIPRLAQEILVIESKNIGKKIEGFKPRYIELLLNYDYPGNTQELHDVIVTSIHNTDKSMVGIDSLAHHMRVIMKSGDRKVPKNR
ncbi:MAG: sigma-54-dependent Fis family transcriptional regulator [Deltaproteobacteria bacterium]|nr:sigma-54-dependent Fis family transcriptional regulator [Deltaproteobacteria bacterium]